MFEQARIDALTPDARNPRRMPEREAAALRRSLEEYGAVEPAVVNSDGTIIGGHMRVEAARQLGWTEFPVVRVDLDDARARLLNLALNRISGEWDEERLAELLAGLRDEDADLALSGFDSGEIDRLLASVDATSGDTEPMEPPAEPRTQPGDVWLLGEHRLLCGDSMDASAVGQLLDGEEAGCVLTDPPYGIQLETDYTKRPNRAGRGLLGDHPQRTYRPVAGDGVRLTPQCLLPSLRQSRSSSGLALITTGARSVRRIWMAHGWCGISATRRPTQCRVAASS